VGAKKRIVAILTIPKKIMKWSDAPDAGVFFMQWMQRKMTTMVLSSGDDV